MSTCPALVSIIIPTRNRRGLLMQTLDSLCDQTYPHWEAVVVDDGSTDGTDVMMERFCRWEPRVRYLHRQGDLTGANVCRNQGVEASQGEYVIFLDSDDLLMPCCLEGRVKVLREHPEADFVVFMGEMFNYRPGDLGVYHNVFDDRDDLERFLHGDNPWSITGPIWRRMALIATGLFDPVLTAAQDWEFHCRVLLMVYRWTKVPHRDYCLRLTGPDRISSPISGQTLNRQTDSARARLRIARLVAERGLMNRSRRDALAGFVVFRAQQLAWGGAVAVAEFLLREAHTSGLLTASQTRILLVLLSSGQRCAISRVATGAVVRVLKLVWCLRITRSKTLLCYRAGDRDGTVCASQYGSAPCL